MTYVYMPLNVILRANTPSLNWNLETQSNKLTLAKLTVSLINPPKEPNKLISHIMNDNSNVILANDNARIKGIQKVTLILLIHITLYLSIILAWGSVV